MPGAVERYLSNLPLIAILRGAPWGFSTQRVFAAGPNISTVFSDVWEGTGDLTYLAAPSLLEVLSDSVDDNGAGIGAQTVTIEGLDLDYKAQAETLVLTGTSPVATTKLFLRVNGFKVATAGTGGGAAGTLTLQASPGSAVQSIISPGSYNTALGSHFTVPADKTAYCIGAKYSSDDQTTRFSLTGREPGSVFRALDVFQTGVAPLDPSFFIPVEIQEKTDLKISARRPTSQSALALVSYDLVLAPKTLAAIRSFGRPLT